MTDPVIYAVAGGEYEAIAPERLTWEQDSYITAQLERAGLTDPALLDLSAAARATELRLRVRESGRNGALLAGFLVQKGQTWSIEGARRVGKALSAATAIEDRVLLDAVLQGVLDGFFGNGRDGDAATGKPSPTADTASSESRASSGPTTSADGSRSSAPSGDSTPTPSSAPAAGPSPTPSAPTSST